MENGRDLLISARASKRGRGCRFGFSGPCSPTFFGHRDSRGATQPPGKASAGSIRCSYRAQAGPRRGYSVHTALGYSVHTALRRDAAGHGNCALRRHRVAGSDAAQAERCSDANSHCGRPEVMQARGGRANCPNRRPLAEVHGRRS